MGYFSKTCAKTNLPVVHSDRGYPALNNVVALLPNGTKITGSYDGYGRVNGTELHDEWDDVKFVLTQHYTIVNPDGFKNYAKYKQVFKKMAKW